MSAKMCFVSSAVMYYRFGREEWIKDEIAHKLIMMYCKVITTANSKHPCAIIEWPYLLTLPCKLVYCTTTGAFML